MLTVHHLSKNFGIQPVLEDISFSLKSNARAGLIGPNGCGKTTLMRILAGLDQPDSGSVVPARHDLRMGYLSQGLSISNDETLEGFLFAEQASMKELESELISLASSLAAQPENLVLQQQYNATLERIQRPITQPQAILGPLGLGEFALNSPVSFLSGGQKTRLMLARILLQEPHLLLLDEPTNHLDISMLEWLETWLQRFTGAALIVSHDRAFLDHTVSSIVELDHSTHRLKAYAGNYSEYITQKLDEREKQAQNYQDQLDELAQLKQAAAHLRGLTRMKKGGKADGGDKFAKGFFANRATRGVAGRAKHIEARIDKILAEEKLEKPRQSWEMKLDFNQPPNPSRDVLVAENLSVGYEPGQPLLSGLNLHIRNGQRIALTGSNGSGKTTLIRTITGRLEPLGGTVRLGPSVRLGYMAQEQELLDKEISALHTIQKVAPFNETEARHFLHFLLFSGDDPLRPVGELSFGERARLQLGLLVAQGCTFLVLDEPINHLDIPSRARFEQALERFQGSVLASVHDRYFIEQFASEIWNITGDSIEKW